MARRRVAACAALAALTSGAPICVDDACATVLDITVSNGNATFTGTCLSGSAIAWCAFGISEDPMGTMYPAEVFMLQVDSGIVYLEDRHNVEYDVPPCFDTQVTQLLNFSSISEQTGFRIQASWTRPLILSTDLFRAGYVQLTSGPLPIISAMHDEAPPPVYAPCRKDLRKHNVFGQRNITFDASATPSPPPTPSPSPSPLYKTCVGSPCYNSLSWRIDGSTISFAANCSLTAAGSPASVASSAIAWCGFGLSPTGAMVPAEAWIIQVDGPSGEVVLEDRLNRNVVDARNVSHPTSMCAPQGGPLPGVSNLTWGAATATWVAANWTRPLALSPDLLAAGFLDIPAGSTNVIAAIRWLAPPAVPAAYVPCATLAAHNASGGAGVTFIAGPSAPAKKKALTEPAKIGIAVAVGLVVLGAAALGVVCFLRRRAAGSTVASKVAADDDLYARLN